MDLEKGSIAPSGAGALETLYITHTFALLHYLSSTPQGLTRDPFQAGKIYHVGVTWPLAGVKAS